MSAIGDSGETFLFDGRRVRKNDLRIDCCGTIDELNASIGVALNYISTATAKQILEQVQNDLFTLGAELAAHPSIKTSANQVGFLDRSVELIKKSLPEQKGFIIPKGSKGATFLHLARTICRRAERLIVRLAEHNETNPELLRYLNRLGTVLYLLARLEKTQELSPEYEKSS